MTVRYELHGDLVGPDLLDEILPVYADAYAGPPYCEGPTEVAAFAASDWPARVAAPGFRLVVARVDRRTVGFVFGHELQGARWWDGALEPLDVDTAEWPGRTFAVIELAVLTGWRRQGIARALHDRLLDGVTSERVTLLVRPEPGAAPARAAYERWGYRRVGQIRPGEGLPVYDAMVMALTREARPS